MRRTWDFNGIYEDCAKRPLKNFSPYRSILNYVPRFVTRRLRTRYVVILLEIRFPRNCGTVTGNRFNQKGAH